MKRIFLARLDEIPQGTGLVKDVGDITLALFKVNGVPYAIDNCCPHQAGFLGEGALYGCLVDCPWHGWPFDVTTGRSPAFPGLSVQTYPLYVEGEEVFLELKEGA